MLGVRQKAYGIERLCDVIGIESSFSAAGTGRISSVKQFGDAIKSEIPEKKLRVVVRNCSDEFFVVSCIF